MTDYSRIDAYVLRLIEESTPERTAWNLEKIREGKKVEWNYIDGCMLTALMEMTSITGDERYAAFAEKVIDHFVQEDGSILTLKPEKANLDDINEGRVLFELYRKTGTEKYRLAGPRPAEGVPPPKTLAWNLWLGTAPVRPYAEKIYHPMIWRSWQDFGTGWSGDIGCHIFDAVWKGMNLGRTAPKTVRAQVQESWKNSPARRADTWPQSNHITWTFDGVPASDGKPFTMEWFDGEFYPPEDGQALARDAGLPKFPEEAAMVFGTGHRGRDPHPAPEAAVPPAEGEVRLREDGEAAVQEPLPRLRGRLPRRGGERLAVPEDRPDGGDHHPRHRRDPLSGGDATLEPRRAGLRRQSCRHGPPAPHLPHRLVRRLGLPGDGSSCIIQKPF